MWSNDCLPLLISMYTLTHTLWWIASVQMETDKQEATLMGPQIICILSAVTSKRFPLELTK